MSGIEHKQQQNYYKFERSLNNGGRFRIHTSSCVTMFLTIPSFRTKAAVTTRYITNKVASLTENLMITHEQHMTQTTT